MVVRLTTKVKGHRQRPSPQHLVVGNQLPSGVRFDDTFHFVSTALVYRSYLEVHLSSICNQRGVQQKDVCCLDIYYTLCFLLGN